MATENITFKLELFATMWDKPPVADILLNGTSHAKQEITGTEEEPQIINYYQSLPEYAIVINNLNEEYDQLVSNYIQLSERLQPYLPIKNEGNLIFLLLVIVIFEFSIIVSILI